MNFPRPWHLIHGKEKINAQRSKDNNHFNYPLKKVHFPMVIRNTPPRQDFIKGQEIFSLLLGWYDQKRRVLPWRAEEGTLPNPYHVWLSEIMLQQTTVITVIPYFHNFVKLWPSIHKLADASLDEIYHAWQGLGYYSRARNLQKCAQILSRDYHGILPRTESELIKLPGVGPYTAAAIAAIAFDEPTIPVDGNIVRVLSRVFSIETPLPQLKDDIWALTQSLIPPQRSGDFAQALMDLGATVCQPRSPKCSECPLTSLCKAYEQGRVSKLPVAAQKAKIPTRYGVVFWVETQDGRVLIQKRGEKGLLAGLMEFPTTPWVEETWKDQDCLAFAPVIDQQWEPLPQGVRHTFTHFHLEFNLVRAMVEKEFESSNERLWVPLSEVKNYALPTLMKKVMKVVLAAR